MAKKTLTPLEQQQRLTKLKRRLGWLLGFMAFALTLLLLAVLFTSPVIRGLQLRSLSEPRPTERLLSLQQGVQICEQHARRRLADSVQQITFDQRSSRYVESLNQYHLFFDLQMTNPNLRHRDPYVICYVHAGDGSIMHYRARNIGSGFNFFQ